LRSGYDSPVAVGCASWAIPSAFDHLVPRYGTSNLERYALRLRAAEINSSFHRSHRDSTWLRWARSVPQRFRFAVKVPKEVTHVARLRDVDERLAQFLAEADLLGEKLGPLLVQLPPSLEFDEGVADAFFARLRGRTTVCEPRHASWFSAEADAFLAERGVARVAADPAPVPEAATPGGSGALRYFRLHGSPRTYHSSYEPAYVDALATTLAAAAAEAPTWCIFDNTASGAALGNALHVVERLVS